MEILLLVNIIFSFAIIGIFSLLLHLYDVLLLKPRKLRSRLQRQGIDGPPASLFTGNLREIKRTQSTKINATLDENSSHNYAAMLFPFFEKCRLEYGSVFMFSLGNMQLLHVNQKEAVKEISVYTSWDLGKPSYQQKEYGPLLGRGIQTSNGAIWAHHRKILAPEFHMDKIKGMVNQMAESAITLVDSWKIRIETEGGTADIKIDENMEYFSGDVISRACFGSSYSKGEEIFTKIRSLRDILLTKKSFPSGILDLIRYIPTKCNREIWRLEKEIYSLILKLVNHRKEAASENDLLQMILEGYKSSDFGQEAMDQLIVDNCKNIYLAAYETTAVSARWILMLLASNPEWQARIRAEVLDICGGQIPDADMLQKMKLLTMVIYESLRLYPPTAIIAREASKDLKFGGIDIPKGVHVWTLVVSLHHDPENWGPDASKFIPERFANGIVGACKFPHLYMPFGYGPRMCLGKNLAMIELKILLSLIISSFSLSLSPKYCHSPALRLLIEPEHGVNLLVRKL